MQESLICKDCLEKIQSACKFKTACSSNLHKMLVDIQMEEADFENYVTCKICKSVVNRNDCIPLFDSIMETDKLNLIKHLNKALVSTYSSNF